MGSEKGRHMPRHTIGEIVASYRSRRGLTKAELARRAGVSGPYLTQIEAGTRKASKPVLMKLAGALGIENYKLLEPAGFRFDSGAYFQRIDEEIAYVRESLQGNSDAAAYFETIIEELPELAQWVGSGPATPTGPDGWDDLETEDQRLVQQLINRLRSEQPTP